MYPQPVFGQDTLKRKPSAPLVPNEAALLQEDRVKAGQSLCALLRSEEGSKIAPRIAVRLWPRLLGLLRDLSPAVRQNAAVAIGLMGAIAAKPGTIGSHVQGEKGKAGKMSQNNPFLLMPAATYSDNRNFIPVSTNAICVKWIEFQVMHNIYSAA